MLSHVSGQDVKDSKACGLSWPKQCEVSVRSAYAYFKRCVQKWDYWTHGIVLERFSSDIGALIINNKYFTMDEIRRDNNTLICGE